MNRSVPPGPDVFEVSIIGPGRGECILVHLGDNEWCVVDSCFSRGSKKCVALEYLQSFGNGASDKIKLIVATHWHDDHIRGLASILHSSPSTARFCCSLALGNENFAKLVAFRSDGIQRRSGVDEFGMVMDLLHKRKEAGMPKQLVSPTWAIEKREILRLPATGRSCHASITALSPSDGTVKLALTDFARWLPAQGQPQLRIPNQSPNRMSVVLSIEVGLRRALLGADLEHTGRKGEGWLAVLASHPEERRATVFKVPHHGSPNADCEEVWQTMLEEEPIAVVTPFIGGRTALPRNTDLRKLSARTARLYCTSAEPGRAPRRDPAIEKTMNRVAKERRVLDGRPGHVRIRWPAHDASALPTIQLFNGAFEVNH